MLMVRCAAAAAALLALGGCTTADALGDVAVDGLPDGPGGGVPVIPIPVDLVPADGPEARPTGALRWVSAADTTPGMRDLCDDAQAIDVSLDGGELDADRDRMGVDCTTPAGENRFLFVYLDGATVLVDGVDLATFDADEAYPTPPVAEGGAGTFDGPGIVLGRNGELPVAAELDAVHVATELSGVATSGETVVVVRNGTDRFAQDVVVEFDGAAVGSVPFTLQPGEEFPVVVGLDPTQLPTVEVTSVLVDEPDPARALLMTGGPGPWSGPVDAFPGARGLVELPATGDVAYYETSIAGVAPTSHPSIDPPADLTGVRVVAATYADGQIVSVQELDVVADLDGTPASSAAGASYGFTGLLLDAPNVALWAWSEEVSA